EEARTLALEIGPCTTSCREDGGIEGTNLSTSGTIVSSTYVPPPPSPDCPECATINDASAVIDGDDFSTWMAPGWGNELVMDLGAKMRVTGFRVLSPIAQTYRIYVWNNLTLGWEEAVYQSSPVREAIHDTCDTATRFVRLVHESTDGSENTYLSELEVFGHRSRQPQTVWLGTDPALSHEAGHAEGTAWAIEPSEGQNVLMSSGPHTRVTAGKRVVEFWVRAMGEPVNGDPVGSVMVVREINGQRYLLKEEPILGRA
ncbi:MAG: hypothetical protein ABIN58_00885, partial [candidate division WOR-3 bacterium]